MNGWSGKIVLMLALAMMPLQGVAATLSVLLCHGDAQMHAVHTNGGQDHGMHHDGHQNEGGATSNPTSHPCCHYTVSAMPGLTLPAALRDFPARAFAPDPLHNLFIPDRPQRPPLA